MKLSPIIFLLGGIVLASNGKWFNGAHLIGVIMIAFAVLCWVLILLILVIAVWANQPSSYRKKRRRR